jgi:hypothetical protein
MNINDKDFTTDAIMALSRITTSMYPDYNEVLENHEAYAAAWRDTIARLYPELMAKPEKSKIAPQNAATPPISNRVRGGIVLGSLLVVTGLVFAVRRRFRASR